MFGKPFRVKSNVALRSSDRRRLMGQVKQLYSNEKNEDMLLNCFSSKAEINILKVQIHKGKVVTVYVFGKEPLFFEIDSCFFPTLAAIWTFNIQIPLLTTQLPVISKLANGADLMLPGVILPTSSAHWTPFTKGDVLGVNTTDNVTCLSVGVALMSSDEMLLCEDKHGKAVQIIHNFGDHLWALGEKRSPPIVQPSTLCCDDELPDDCKNESTSNTESLNVDQEDSENKLNEPMLQIEKVKIDPMSNESKEIETADNPPQTNLEKLDLEVMDELLEYCFLNALKAKLKDKELPILASTFYRNHVLSSCPDGKFLDIKKTTYKKFGKYLKHVTDAGLIMVKELSKGNDNIVSVNRTHDLYRSFKIISTIPLEEATVPNTESYCGVVTNKVYEAPEITVVYGISHTTKNLFMQLGVKKGRILTASEIRQLITTYVKVNNLAKGKLVTLDPILHDAVCMKGEENVLEVSWDYLFKGLVSKMQLNHKISFKGIDPIIKKGESPAIQITTQVRTGNKKVTLVKNLESFYIDPQEFADLIRKQAQASTSLSTIPGSNPKNPSQQLMIQGNQVNCIESILTGERYKLSSKYITGLENAPKKKGKGKR